MRGKLVRSTLREATTMKSSFTLGRIAGIDIGVHYTWVFAFILIAWSLSAGFFPQIAPGGTVAAYWILGILASLALFVSVLLHEMAHSLVAKSRGLNVSSITLFIFGGVSNLQEEPKSAGTEFAMAIVGPLTSLVLGGILFGVGVTMGVQDSPFALLVGGNISQYPPGPAFIYYLSSINIILGIFNLIPGFPLDGGRVLRSIIWGSTKNLSKSTNIAALFGRFFGWAFIAYGVFTLLGGNFLGGLWIAFIGWFLASAADASRREVTLREQLSGVKVSRVMNTKPVTIKASTTVEEVVHNAFLQCHCRAVPVTNDSRAIGIVTLDDVKKVGKDRWAYTSAEQIMTKEPLYSVSPEDDLSTALNLLSQHEINQLLVLKDGELAGLITRADIIRYLQMSQELGMKSKSQ